VKFIDKYTVTGQTLHGTEKEIRLFDGRFDTGYRITRFEVYPDTTVDPQNCSCKLVTEPGTSLQGQTWNWGSSIEVGWSFAKIGSGTSQLSDDRYAIIDPDNMIVEDLFIQAYSSDGDGQKINYLIELEKYDITDWQGALSMVRNKSQA
jgi:hypothetical protein